MNDHDMNPMCLSAEEHHNPRDPVLHYLGCLEFGKREDYFSGLEENEKSQIEASLRRTEYLRKILDGTTDKEAKTLVKNLQKSFEAWRKCPDFERGIDEVRVWSGGKDQYQRAPNPSNATSASPTSTDRRPFTYDPDHDMNAYLIQYKDSRPVNDLRDLGFSSEFKFPNHKIRVAKLLDEKSDVKPLWEAKKSSKQSSKLINYFHLPSNNMAVSRAFLKRYLAEPSLTLI